MEEYVLPNIAVVCPEDKDAAVELMVFLERYGFSWGGAGGGLLSNFEHMWEYDGGNTCFDISTTKKRVRHSSFTYYHDRYLDDYPNEHPDNEKWFLCSVADFMAMCGGRDGPEFDIADEVELSSFLFS